jgi:hypothetical protein
MDRQGRDDHVRTVGLYFYHSFECIAYIMFSLMMGNNDAGRGECCWI